eukprot:703465-Hanusia_phi.AAC.2
MRPGEWARVEPGAQWGTTCRSARLRYFTINPKIEPSSSRTKKFAKETMCCYSTAIYLGELGISEVRFKISEYDRRSSYDLDQPRQSEASSETRTVAFVDGLYPDPLSGGDGLPGSHQPEAQW